MRCLCAVYAQLSGPGITSLSMEIILVLLMRLLELAFFVGLAGSAVVVVISFIEDFGELLPHRKH